jgi:hypothetical protein
MWADIIVIGVGAILACIARRLAAVDTHCSDAAPTPEAA